MEQGQKPHQKAEGFGARTGDTITDRSLVEAAVVAAQSSARTGPKAVPWTGEPSNAVRSMGAVEKSMNIFDKMSLWWEARKTVKRAEFDLFKHNLIKTLEEERKSNVAAKIAELLVRMDRLELYVGLKRDQKLVEVPGSARIK